MTTDDSFKVKINGQKLRVRFMHDDETIKATSLHCFVGEHAKELILSDPDSSNVIRPYVDFLAQSSCAGEKVGEHKDRLYIEILSFFYATFDRPRTDYQEDSDGQMSEVS